MAFNNQRQNLAFSELAQWAKTNPNKCKLTPIGILKSVDAVKVPEENTLDNIGLKQFESITLSPSGMLGTIAWLSDTTYQNSPLNIRMGLLRNTATSLQEKTDTLQGTHLSRKRRKIHDGIGNLANNGTVKPEEWLDLFSSLAYMIDTQLIFIKMQTVEETGEEREDREGRGAEKEGEGADKMIFFSSNPESWTPEKKTYIVDYHGRWVASPTTEDAVKDIPEWVSDLDTNGWVVEWHTNNSMTKEEIVNILSRLPAWQDTHAKLKKDVLLRRLARVCTIDACRRVYSSDK